MANLLILSKPYVSVGLTTSSYTAPSTGLYNVLFQATLPSAASTGDGAGSGTGLGSGAGGGELGGFSLGGAIPVDAEPAIPAVAASLEDQDIIYTAVDAGEAGNSISVEIINPGGTSALSIDVSGNAIIVSLETSAGVVVTDADALVAALLAESDVTDLIDVEGSGSDLLVALAPTFLEDGADSVPAVEESGAGAKGQGFGPDLDGYPQPPSYGSNESSGPVVQSALSVVVNVNGSPVYTSPAIAYIQQGIEFATNLNLTAADVVTVVMTSANAADSELNSLKSSCTINQGLKS